MMSGVDDPRSKRGDDLIKCLSPLHVYVPYPLSYRNDADEVNGLWINLSQTCCANK